MLYKVKSLKGYNLHGIDGDMGKIKEFYFDDDHWTIRYLVSETGNWLMDRQVLISPHALLSVDDEGQFISVNLTKKQIEDSPPLNTAKPVSRQFETDYFGYYGWPMYWTGSFMWGAFPDMTQTGIMPEKEIESEKPKDSHLRSSAAVSGYYIQASDGEIGHVEDFIIDDKTWAIRYLVIDTQNWLPGKKVLISPRWIEDISWEDSKVYVNLLRETIKSAPELTEEALITRSYETELYQHYNRPSYWAGESAAEAESQDK